MEQYITDIRLGAEEEISWFQTRRTLAEAVEIAALATNREGKRFSHQYRIKRVSLQKSRLILKASLLKLRSCKSFEQLHDLVESLLTEVYGIGELYIYDTALRIGAKLGLQPSLIFLHAGTRQGARAVHLDHKLDRLSPQMLPRELQRLRPHEVEDFLCIFRDHI